MGGNGYGNGNGNGHGGNGYANGNGYGGNGNGYGGSSGYGHGGNGHGGNGHDYDDGNRGSNGRREMFDATCAACGAPARVPFRPANGRPVYCRECYSSRQGQGSGYGGGY
jgi:CxxC-x17-CxxC domain-containing protein